MLYSRFKLRLSSSVKLLWYYARLVKRHATLNIMGIDMARRILESSHIHPNIQAIIENSHGDIIEQVQSAVTNNNVVVVGMAQNPAPKRARKVLNDNNIDHVYLEYGSYFKEWRRRHNSPFRATPRISQLALTASSARYSANTLLDKLDNLAGDIFVGRLLNAFKPTHCAGWVCIAYFS